MKKMKNSKGYYRLGRVTYRDTADGESVLYTQVRISNPEFKKYVQYLVEMSDGELTASHIIGALAVLGFKRGVRLSDDKMSVEEGEI